MNFEIINTEGNEVTSFELESNPFKVGENLYINVSNNDFMFWNKEEINKKLEIIKIEHFSRQMYLPNQKYHFIFTVSVTVEEVNED